MDEDAAVMDGEGGDGRGWPAVVWWWKLFGRICIGCFDAHHQIYHHSSFFRVAISQIEKKRWLLEIEIENESEL